MLWVEPLLLDLWWSFRLLTDLSMTDARTLAYVLSSSNLPSLSSHAAIVANSAATFSPPSNVPTEPTEPSSLTSTTWGIQLNNNFSHLVTDIRRNNFFFKSNKCIKSLNLTFFIHQVRLYFKFLNIYEEQAIYFFITLIEFNLDRETANMIEATLTNTYYKIKVWGELSDPQLSNLTDAVVRLADGLSPLLPYCSLEKVIIKSNK